MATREAEKGAASRQNAGSRGYPRRPAELAHARLIPQPPHSRLSWSVPSRVHARSDATAPRRSLDLCEKEAGEGVAVALVTGMSEFPAGWGRRGVRAV